MKKLFIAFIGSLLLLIGSDAVADQVILDDLIVDGSACIGFDCVNGEAFGFDTIRIKENNLRIKAEDTSTTASFPSNDWQITFNDSANGGANKFSIDDIDGGRTPFTIEAGAPSHSLYVDDGGRLGLGTSTPVVELHVVDGDTPTLRLEQDGSSGFSPQTWDVAGNEANFFIRDATNGSTLPFRIFPSSSSNVLNIAGSSVGIGTTSPAAQLHVKASAGGATPRMLFENPDAIAGNQKWFFDIKDGSGDFRISRLGSGVQEMNLTPSGNVTIPGNYISGGTTLNVPDYVFEPGYPLLPLDELSDFIEREKHLPNLPSAEEIHKNGINLTAFQMKLLEKVEELTLYMVAQEQTIRELKERLEGIESAKN